MRAVVHTICIPHCDHQQVACPLHADTAGTALMCLVRVLFHVLERCKRRK